MREQEALETAALQSLAGSFAIERWRRRPFRNPHHTSSGVALVGGGPVPRPGEISLAHHGVLFLVIGTVSALDLALPQPCWETARTH
jgi:magnesium chelatase family protein